MSASLAFTLYVIFYLINTMGILYLIPNTQYLVHLWIISSYRVLLLIGLCSFIGLPPLAGFWIKVFAIMATFNSMYAPFLLTSTVLVLTVASSFIYFKWFKYVFLIYDKIVHYPTTLEGYGIIISNLLLITASVFIFDYLVWILA